MRILLVWKPGSGLAPSGAMGKGDFVSCDEAETSIERVERYIVDKLVNHTKNARIDYSFKPPKTPEDLSECRFNPTNIR